MNRRWRQRLGWACALIALHCCASSCSGKDEPSETKVLAEKYCDYLLECFPDVYGGNEDDCHSEIKRTLRRQCESQYEDYYECRLEAYNGDCANDTRDACESEDNSVYVCEEQI